MVSLGETCVKKIFRVGKGFLVDYVGWGARKNILKIPPPNPVLSVLWYVFAPNSVFLQIIYRNISKVWRPIEKISFFPPQIKWFSLEPKMFFINNVMRLVGAIPHLQCSEKEKFHPIISLKRRICKLLPIYWAISTLTPLPANDMELIHYCRYFFSSTSLFFRIILCLSLIHIWRCRRSTLCRSRWSPYH